MAGKNQVNVFSRAVCSLQATVPNDRMFTEGMIWRLSLYFTNNHIEKDPKTGFQK